MHTHRPIHAYTHRHIDEDDAGAASGYDICVIDRYHYILKHIGNLHIISLSVSAYHLSRVFVPFRRLVRTEPLHHLRLNVQHRCDC